jgi:hypothetical protein
MSQAAGLLKEGTASFHRQRIKVDLASEYDNEICLCLEEIKELEQLLPPLRGVVAI